MKQQELKSLADACVRKFNTLVPGEGLFHEPYTHVVVDNFLPEEIANTCLESFPSLNESGWEQSNDADIEVKYRTTWQSEFDIPEGIVDVIRVLNSAPILKAMSTCLGIPKLMPDPYFSGGGLNLSTKGGLLDVHVDGNYHDASGLNRRANVLIYLNPGWKEEYGGSFGIYSNTGDKLVKNIAPLFNRLVLFDSHDYSFHGLPDPINFPKDNPRRSIILYYYTKESRPDHQVRESSPHSALWVKRNLKDKRGNDTRKSY